MNSSQGDLGSVDLFIRVIGFLFFTFGFLSVGFRIVQFGLLGDPPLVELVRYQRFLYFQGLPSLVASVFFLLGITALYLKQAEKAGVFGLVSFLIAFFAITISTGAMWTYALTAPVVAREAPELLTSPTSGLIRAVLGSLMLGQAGWLLMGVSALRAKVIPRWAVMVLLGSMVLVAVLTPLANTQTLRLIYNILLGTGPLAVGYVLWTGKTTRHSNRRLSPKVD